MTCQEEKTLYEDMYVQKVCSLESFKSLRVTNNSSDVKTYKEAQENIKRILEQVEKNGDVALCLKTNLGLHQAEYESAENTLRESDPEMIRFSKLQVNSKKAALYAAQEASKAFRVMTDKPEEWATFRDCLSRRSSKIKSDGLVDSHRLDSIVQYCNSEENRLSNKIGTLGLTPSEYENTFLRSQVIAVILSNYKKILSERVEKFTLMPKEELNRLDNEHLEILAKVTELKDLSLRYFNEYQKRKRDPETLKLYSAVQKELKQELEKVVESGNPELCLKCSYHINRLEREFFLENLPENKIRSKIEEAATREALTRSEDAMKGYAYLAEKPELWVEFMACLPSKSKSKYDAVNKYCWGEKKALTGSSGLYDAEIDIVSLRRKMIMVLAQEYKKMRRLALKKYGMDEKERKQDARK